MCYALITYNTIDEFRNNYDLNDDHLRDLLELSCSTGRKKHSNGTWSVYHASKKDKDETVSYITRCRSKDAWSSSKLFYNLALLVA